MIPARYAIVRASGAQNHKLGFAPLPIYGELETANRTGGQLLLWLFSCDTQPLKKASDMANDWILDVLSDLKTFADSNGLPALALQLQDATLIAAAELASQEGPLDHERWDAGHAGANYRAFRAG